MAGEARTGFRVFHGFVGGGATRGVGPGAGVLISTFSFLSLGAISFDVSFSLPSLSSLVDGVVDDDAALECVDSAE